MEHSKGITDFEKIILPHLSAAYNLARWLTKNNEDASDIVQEASLKAFRFFDTFRGNNPKAWLLSIVRNTFYSKTESDKQKRSEQVFDEESYIMQNDESSPEQILLKIENTKILKDMIEKLPLEFREAIVLRELEELSYKEIAEILNIPRGTVMSRLARGRKLLQDLLIKIKDD